MAGTEIVYHSIGGKEWGNEWLVEYSPVVEWQWLGEHAVSVDKPVLLPLSYISHAALPSINPGPPLWLGGD
jgi:hypothetical protein